MAPTYPGAWSAGTLVELRKGGAHRRDGEQQSRYAHQRVLHGGDAPDRAEVGDQSGHHVAEELAPALVSEAFGDFDDVFVVGRQAEVQPIGFPSSRFLQPVDGNGDEHARRADEQEGPTPAEGVADESAKTDSQPKAYEHQALLDGEGQPPLFERVVVGQQAGARRLRDGLTESER